MANCSSTPLFINRPTKASAAAACNSINCGGTANLGVSDPLNLRELSPRPNRGKVRGQIKDQVLLMLGAPVITIELDEQQLDAAVDLALQVFEDYAPREYFQYYVFNTIPGKSVYEMPPDVGFVRNVFYKQSGTFAFQSSDLGGAIPVEYFYPGGAYASITGGMIDPIQPVWGRMGEWVLYKQYEQMYSRIASNLGGWEWVGGFNNIKIYPIPFRVHQVIVHYLQKHTDWKQVTQAMQEGALIYAKTMLGRIRGRIKNPPGPNQGVQLDSDTLLQESREDMKQWREDLLSRYGDLPYISMG